MDSQLKKWAFGGSSLLIGLSSLVISTGVMKPWNPMPLHQVVLAWVIGFFFVLVVPAIYLVLMLTLARLESFSKVVFFITLFLSGLNAIYFWEAWSYGYKYQGEFHTIFVGVINAFGFGVTLYLAAFGMNRNNKNITNTANLMLFSLLAWCAFPYLGELP